LRTRLRTEERWVEVEREKEVESENLKESWEILP